MTYGSINLESKFGLFSEPWSPKVVAEMNDYQFKLLKLQGEFVWHSHKGTDEAFIVIKGAMKIAFRDGEVTLNKDDMFVVPKGVEHKPSAAAECWAVIVEPRNVINTGNTGGGMTAPNDIWV